jgi:phosphatidate phosphatase APP1
MSRVGRALWLVAGLFAIAAAVAADEPQAIVYPGLGDARGFVIEGRLIEKRRSAAERGQDRWWTNLWRTLGRLVNDEQPGVTLMLRSGAQAWEVKTDTEGYFRLEAAAAGSAPGWQQLEVSDPTGAVLGEGRWLKVAAENTVGIISDVDDTIQVSEVTDTSRLLANTLLKNPVQRQAVAGMAGYYRRLLAANPQPEAAAMIYLSASPRQLSGAIERFLEHHAFPPGVLITKKVTNDADREPLTDQAAYKTAKIEAVFARLPHVRFVLVGDDGERDPEVYDAIRARHPQRVSAVLIRRVHPDPRRPRIPGQLDVDRVLAEAARTGPRGGLPSGRQQ